MIEFDFLLCLAEVFMGEAHLLTRSRAFITAGFIVITSRVTNICILPFCFSFRSYCWCCGCISKDNKETKGISRCQSNYNRIRSISRGGRRLFPAELPWPLRIQVQIDPIDQICILLSHNKQNSWWFDRFQVAPFPLSLNQLQFYCYLLIKMSK